MKRKLLCLAAALCLCLGFALPAHAEDTGYRITQYTIDATLHENNTVSQTETIQVHYNEERHGIFRAFPEIVYVWRTVNNERVKMAYNVKIKNISVEGAPYTDYSEDEMRYIRIGDEYDVVVGDVTYVISYLYDIGDDRVADYDELYYSLNGPDWDTSIDNFSFTLHFDKALPADSLQNLALYSGAYGAEGNDANIEYTATETTVQGKAPGTLPAGTSVTLFTRLPEGYFTGERSISMIPAWIAFAFLCAAVGYTLLRMLRTRHRQPVQTVEFYPPEGLNSADVGYIIDGTADDRDLISLIIWFADQGYLTISPEEDTMVLTRVKNFSDSEPPYLKKFFNTLFPGSQTTRRLDDVSGDFYKNFYDAKLALDTYYSTENKLLYKPSSHFVAFALPIGCAILWGIFAFFASCLIEPYLIIFIAVSVVAMGLATLFSISADGRSDFASPLSKIWSGIAPILMLLLGLLCACVPWGESLLSPAWLIMAGALAASACCLLAPRLVEETDFRIEMAGKLLGLRDFIKKAELPRLKLLVDENPSYFYNVLPYAYVFGLSDKWAKQFESLAVAPPAWYTGTETFSYLWFDSAMRHSLDGSLHELHTESLNSGSGGDSSWGSGSSGGGFSGGGFGGGGGGSW